MNNFTECQHGLLKTNSVIQGGITPDNMIDNVLLYDVNVGLSDVDIELSNVMLLKDGWKRHVPYIEKYCTDFSLWKSQTIHLGLFHLIFVYFIYLFGVLRRFQHCTGHITTGSWNGRGNQYIQLVKVLCCKLPTNGK